MCAAVVSAPFHLLNSDTRRGSPVLVALQADRMADDFTTLLRDAGYAVVQAVSLDEACDLIARQEVGLALIDIEWGQAGVTRVTEAAHTRSRPCPVGVVVGWWDDRVGDVYRMADLLVYNPPNERQLLTAVESAVAWQELGA